MRPSASRTCRAAKRIRHRSPASEAVSGVTVPLRPSRRTRPVQRPWLSCTRAVPLRQICPPKGRQMGNPQAARLVILHFVARPPRPIVHYHRRHLNRSERQSERWSERRRPSRRMPFTSSPGLSFTAIADPPSEVSDPPWRMSDGVNDPANTPCALPGMPPRPW